MIPIAKPISLRIPLPIEGIIGKAEAAGEAGTTLRNSGEEFQPRTAATKLGELAGKPSQTETQSQPSTAAKRHSTEMTPAGP